MAGLTGTGRDELIVDAYAEATTEPSGPAKKIVYASSPVLTLTTPLGAPKISNNQIYVDNNGSTVKINVSASDSPAKKYDTSILTNGKLLVGTYSDNWVSSSTSSDIPNGSTLTPLCSSGCSKGYFEWTPPVGTTQKTVISFAASNITANKTSKPRSITIYVGPAVKSVLTKSASWSSKTNKFTVNGVVVPNKGYSLSGALVTLQDSSGNLLARTNVKGATWIYSGPTFKGGAPTDDYVVADVEGIQAPTAKIKGLNATSPSPCPVGKTWMQMEPGDPNSWMCM